jgi:hypothetical protein
MLRCSRISKSFPNGMDIGIYMVQVMGNPAVPPVTTRPLGPKGPGISIMEKMKIFLLRVQHVLSLSWHEIDK